MSTQRMTSRTQALALAVAIFAACSTPYEDEDEDENEDEVLRETSQEIINGYMITSPERSGMVALYWVGCSATIVNREWVLTANHCIPWWQDTNGDKILSSSSGEIPSEWTVGPAINQNGESATFYVKKIIRHPTASDNTYGNVTDIALIQIDAARSGYFNISALDPTMYSNGGLRLFCGLTSSLPGQTLLTYGLGLTAPDDSTPRGPRWARLPVVSFTDMSHVSHAGYSFSANSSGQIICQGDSGGPSFLETYVGGSLVKRELTGVHTVANCVNAAGDDSVEDFRNWLFSTVPGLPECNLALKRPASQSSTALNASASRAVDGNTDGDFYHNSVTHTNNEYEPWWDVDLGANRAIKRIEIYNRTDCCAERLSDFQIFTRTSQGTWSLYANRWAVGLPLFKFENVNRTARYVRIRLMNRGLRPLSLAEVKVFDY